MSQADAAHSGHGEIVIVRHGHGDHDDGHHGGVWKIAFADFMTAMMCFFLVMWLINASNDQTKAAVASYFNPVKLIDRNASRKGLEDIGDGPQSSGEDHEDASNKAAGDAKAGPADKKGASESSEKLTDADDQLFADPYAVLAEIAEETGTQQNVSAKGSGGASKAGPATGASGGEAYRDPFAPDFWSQQIATPSEAEASAEIPKPEVIEDFVETKEAPATDVEASEAAQSKILETEPQAPDAPADAKAAEAAKDQPEQPTSETVAAADQIRSELAKALLPDDRVRDGLSVVATDKGVKISVTDQLEFGMYEIGSAVPRRELVLAMEKISKALSGQKGMIAISGHTDARPFKGGSYDNWQLSSARAQSAYYMLARAGLDEQRVIEVAGRAERELKDKKDPLAAANRRIEILLEVAP